jgi:hypothetical protein
LKNDWLEAADFHFGVGPSPMMPGLPKIRN